MPFHLPLWIVCVLVTSLSLGYDLSQPLLAGIVTDFGKHQTGQAIGLNVFMLFLGAGLGSLAFGALIRYGWTASLLTFAMMETILSVIGFRVFRNESWRSR